MRNVLLLLALLIGYGPAPAQAALQVGSHPVLPSTAPATGQILELGPAGDASLLALDLQRSNLYPAHPQQLDVRLWVEGERDLFQRGDRLQLRFRTARDAHVAVLHIDTHGRIEFLFPYSPWDNDFVRGHRIYTLPSGHWNTHWMVDGAPGIGYFYIIASPVPLDYRRFQLGSRWDLSWAGGSVRGDPFWALEQITELLVPHGMRLPYAVDYYSYHVGRRVPYPTYACYDRPGVWGRSVWNAYYGSCDRISVLLRSHPHYYDARRYRGDRRVYWQQLERPAPRHSFKERADLLDTRQGVAPLRPQPQGQATGAEGRTRPTPVPSRVEPERTQERGQRVRPERQRPTLERRPPERSPERRPAAEPERRRDPPPAQPERRRDPPRAQPQRRPDPPAPQRAEPQRQEPRRDARSGEPRVNAPAPARPEREPPGA